MALPVIATHFSGDWSWIPKYTDDYFIFNRSDEFIPNSRKVDNIGNADYDKLTYIVENYHSLPEAFILTKTNLFKYITKAEFEAVKENRSFTPLLTRNHVTKLPVAFYDVHGMYWEVANSWFFNHVPGKYVKSWEEWCDLFGFRKSEYIPFAPGGSYIVTRERIHRYPKAFYEKMRSMLPWHVTPVEAQCVERSYFLMWR